MISDLSPSQILQIKTQLSSGKQPHEISRTKNKDGSITRHFRNEDVREVRSLMRTGAV